jgi:hypothetical protein
MAPMVEQVHPEDIDQEGSQLAGFVDGEGRRKI